MTAHSSSRAFVLAAASVLVAIVSSCARVGSTWPVTSEQIVATEPARRVVPGAVGTFELVGSRASVYVRHRCDIYERRFVQRTTRQHKTNETPWRDYLWLGAGILTTGAGAALAIDSTRVGQADPHAATYNPVGPALPLGLGIGLLALGAGFLTVPVVDLVRTSGETITISNAVDEVSAAKSGACIPYAGGEVRALHGPRVYALGRLRTDGTLDIDVDTVVDPDASMRRTDMLSVEVDRHETVRVPLAALALTRERAFWRTIDHEACRAPKGPDDCAKVYAYALRFPDGTHASEARALLLRAEPLLADERAWAEAEPHLCASKSGHAPPDKGSSGAHEHKARSAAVPAVHAPPKKGGHAAPSHEKKGAHGAGHGGGHAEGPCDGVRRYLVARPTGGHAEEARAMLRKRGYWVPGAVGSDAGSHGGHSSHSPKPGPAHHGSTGHGSPTPYPSPAHPGGGHGDPHAPKDPAKSACHTKCQLTCARWDVDVSKCIADCQSQTCR